MGLTVPTIIDMLRVGSKRGGNRAPILTTTRPKETNYG